MTANWLKRHFTVWRAIFAAVMAAGAYATWVRFHYGLGAATNLNDAFPWGLWIGFDVLCGVGLAAGGFTLAAVVHIFRLERYKPIVRPAILTAFLGYLLVVVALLFDLGRPDRIWHPLILWNPRSVMFEVAWCVTLYTTVLALEFSPAVLERFRLHRVRRVVKTIMVPLVVIGVLLSTLHQSSLGSLYLIVPHKLHSLWYTPALPVLFYVSALCIGLAMTIFEARHSSKAFGRPLELPLLAGLGRVLAVLIAFYLSIRFVDLVKRGALAGALAPRWESWMFGLEISLIVLAMLLLFRRRVRTSPAGLYTCAVLALLGFVANRLNVSITGMEAAASRAYVPKWTEVAVTLSMIAAGFALFHLAASYLPVLERHPAAASGPVELPVVSGESRELAQVS